MKKLVLALIFLFAATSVSMAGTVGVDLTLVPSTSSINYIKTVLTIYGIPATDYSTASTAAGEFTKIDLDISFNPYDNSVDSISGIKFYEQVNVGPINFDDDMMFVYNLGPNGILQVDTVGIGGCLETLESPMSTVTDGSFLGTEQRLNLDKGYFNMSGTAVPDGYQANLYTDPAYKPMVDPGTVSVTLNSISGSDAIYDVVVEQPMEFIHPIPNPAGGDDIGEMVSTGLLKWTGTITSPLPIPGDANLNGVVDAEDAAFMADHWLEGPDATWAMGDFTGDGYVNDADVTLLAANWNGDGSPPASVPEPTSLAALLAVALAGLTLWRRR